MGGTSSTTNRTGTTNQQGTATVQPWEGASGQLSGLLSQLGSIPSINGGQTDALNKLQHLGMQGNQFAPAIGGVANNLLSGGGANAQAGTLNDAYQRYIQQINPTAQGDFTDPNKNPFFAKTTETIGNDVTNRLKGLYAGSGRDPAGAGGNFAYNLSRGIGEATAPVFSNVYQQERQNQLGAASNLFGAGGSTAQNLTNLNQLGLGNMQAGIGAAGQANQAEQYGPLLQLQAASQAQGIPLQTLLSQLSISGQLGQAFGTRQTSGTGTEQSTAQTQTPFNPWSLAPSLLSFV